jgi:hypothetical protein
VDARVGVEGAALDQLALAPLQGLLVEAGRPQIPEDAFEVAEAERLGAGRGLNTPKFSTGFLLGRNCEKPGRRADGLCCGRADSGFDPVAQPA